MNPAKTVVVVFIVFLMYFIGQGEETTVLNPKLHTLN